jgi:peptidyl-prolyl cis-trans isomerase C
MSGRALFLRGLVLGLCFAPVLFGCRKPPPPPDITALPSQTVPPEQVAAVVDGHPISLEDVAAQARAAGTSASEALSALVRAELLAREAERRGMVKDREVQWVGRRESVRAYLSHTFEKEVTPETAVDEAHLRKAYEQKRGRLVHPLIKQVSHILITTDKEDPVARGLMDKVHDQAVKAKTQEEFEKIGHDNADAVRAAGFSLTVQQGFTGREGWTEEPFAKAAFELKQPGDVSRVVRTKFGYHVIRLIRDQPAENITFEQAEPKIRADLFGPAQQRAFQKLLGDLEKQHQVAVYPERLSQVKDDAEAAP